MDREQDAQLELEEGEREGDARYVEMVVGERDLPNRRRRAG